MASSRTTLPGPTLAIIVFAVMAALYGIDKFLAAQEQHEIEETAAKHATTGEQLLRTGKPAQAIVEFSRAVSLERSNRQYQLNLAEAQLADRRLSAARETLDQVLDEDSNDGQANLLMARTLAAAGQFKDANSYFHRAIYGEWPARSSKPAQVRLELAGMLADHGTPQELLSELLLLENNSTGNAAVEKQIAGLFLKAGSVEHAIDVWRRLTRETPDDVEAYIALAHAELLTGNYRAAENTLFNVLRRQPYQTEVQSQLRLVVRLASLDPTSRHLSSAEKYRRSQHILELTQAELNQCTNNPQPVTPEKVEGPITNELADARLDQAETLWNQRSQLCKQPPSSDDPLPLLMRKLSQ